MRSDDIDKNRPRAGEFADKPGTYKLVARSNRQLLDPGEDLWIEVFITGYGNIQAAKLVSSPDKESISGKESKVWFNLRETEGKPHFGGTEKEFGEDGVTIDLGSGGLKLPKWDRSTLFVDVSKGPTPLILTERILRHTNNPSNAPVTINLKLSKNARPGQHSLNLVLTYYNGECWCSSETTFHFVVRNFYQRHEIRLWKLGFFATLTGLSIGFFSILMTYGVWGLVFIVVLVVLAIGFWRFLTNRGIT